MRTDTLQRVEGTGYMISICLISFDFFPNKKFENTADDARGKYPYIPGAIWNGARIHEKRLNTYIYSMMIL